MSRELVLLAVTLFAPLAAPTRAHMPAPPVIQVTSQSRSVHLVLQSDRYSIFPGW